MFNFAENFFNFGFLSLIGNKNNFCPCFGTRVSSQFWAIFHGFHGHFSHFRGFRGYFSPKIHVFHGFLWQNLKRILFQFPRAKRAVLFGQQGVGEVPHSTAERAAAEVWGAAPEKNWDFLRFIYPLQALLAIENSFQISFWQHKNLHFFKENFCLQSPLFM